jgi:hypothetical protein
MDMGSMRYLLIDMVKYYYLGTKKGQKFHAFIHSTTIIVVGKKIHPCGHPLPVSSYHTRQANGIN